MRYTNDPKYPPGTIVVPTGVLASYTDFYIHLMQLQVPQDTKMVIPQSIDVAHNLNQGIRHMEGEWLFMLGHDHIFREDIILRLLDRQVDYVAPLCSTRVLPYLPLAFRERMPDGAYVRYNWDELPTHGMLSVAGTAGVALVSKKAIQTLKPPYFEQNRSDSGFMGEDLCFQNKLIENGISIYVDCDVTIGHINPSVVWPLLNSEKKYQAACNLSSSEWTWITPQKLAMPGEAP